ncbi:MAG: accessory Sec system protein Asp2 [Lactovum sp.]
MKYLQIKIKKFKNIETALSVEDCLYRQGINYLLLDCREIKDLDLENLIENVRSRFIVYAYANEEQDKKLKEMGHFDLTEIWESSNFIDQLDFIFDDLAQTQGFSMLPDEAAEISNHFQGYIERHGRYEMFVEGEFEEETVLLDFKKIVKNWGRTIFVMPFRRFYNSAGRYHLTFDYETSGDLQVIYVIYTLDRRGNLLRKERITEKEYVFQADENVEFKGQILLKGKGTVTLGKVWTYKEKYGLGWFQAGDERTETKNKEFIHSYFIPGKRKEKLIVGFSGNLSELAHYERQSMATYGFPVLLFCDLRARGGAFHIGRNLSIDYAQTLIGIINQKLKRLGLTHSDLIMVGWSMGSFPAMYYGIKLRASDIIAAKPLLHLGNVTGDAEISFRSEPSMIAAREYLTGRYHPNDQEELNEVIYELLKVSDLSEINFYTFMMKNDELDRCESLFNFIASHAKSVESHSEQGFHSEKIPVMSQWINKILDRISNQIKLS